MVNDMLLQQWHVIDGLHVQVLIIGQDDNDIWPVVRLESHLLPRPGGERKSSEADEALHRHSTANSKVRARPPTERISRSSNVNPTQGRGRHLAIN